MFLGTILNQKISLSQLLLVVNGFILSVRECDFFRAVTTVKSFTVVFWKLSMTEWM